MRRRALLTMRSTCCGVAKFFKSGDWDKVPEGSTPIFGDTHISLYHSVVWVEGSNHTQNQLDSSSRFNTIPACDGRADGHKTTAYTALA